MPRPLLAVLVGLCTSQVGIVCTTVYLHRTLSHRAVKMNPSLSFLFRLVTWLATGIKPREWVAVHRRHHAATDVEGDPHSPLLLGLWRVELTNAYLYRMAARDRTTVERYAKDLPPDRWDRLIFDRPLVGLGISITALCLVFGWQCGLLAAFVHTAAYLLLNGAVNSFAHWNGKKYYENTATNLQWLAFLTAGEGLHNNHHAAPTSARLAHRRGEIDPGWWFIRAFARLGIAEVRLAEPKTTAGASAT